MPMIPLSYALAGALLTVAWLQLARVGAPMRNPFMPIFLTMLILHLVLIGTRFGYGVLWLGHIQPLTAALAIPLAYLSFKNPAHDSTGRVLHLTIHLLPVVVALFAIAFARDYIDIAQAIFTFVYAVALARLGKKGGDALPWAAVEGSHAVLRLLWLTVGLLLVSSLTDVLVALDFWTTGGTRTGTIAGRATIGALVLVTAGAAAFRWFKPKQRDLAQRGQANRDLGEVLDRVRSVVATAQIHLDPELSLNRLARKVGVPQRHVSEAINRELGITVTQYINNLRIEEACKQLTRTDHSITSIMLRSGFNTKSNFNREFKRNLGVSPTQWRHAQQQKQS